jgi:hypothetical protein
MNNLKAFTLGICLSIAALGAIALGENLPNVFAAGTVISTAKMNENFAALKSNLEALETRIANLEEFKKAIPSARGNI